MELIILSILVGMLAILQGWQMFQKKRNSNPGNPSSQLNGKLDDIVRILGRMEQRLNDIWEKVNK